MSEIQPRFLLIHSNDTIIQLTNLEEHTDSLEQSLSYFFIMHPQVAAWQIALVN